jgi:hypothetical protein
MTIRRRLRDRSRRELLARRRVRLTESTMPAKRYKVRLEADERRELERLISRGKGAARRLAYARILLHANSGAGGPGKADAAIAEAVGVSVATIERVRQRFVEDGLEAALAPRPPRWLDPRKLSQSMSLRFGRLNRRPSRHAPPPQTGTF